MKDESDLRLEKFFVKKALDDGWTVKKKNEDYILTKKHEGKKEFFRQDFLRRFMQSIFKKKCIT